MCTAVDDLLGADLAICEAISMEVLAGARNEHHLAQLRGLLARASLLPMLAEDYGQAAGSTQHAAATEKSCAGSSAA